VTCQLVSLCFDALDPSRLSSFWSGVLGFEKVDDAEDGFPLIPDDDTGFKIRFRPTRTPKEGHVVLADPEGNEFCVIEPGNSFLADCGLIGALASDGSQEVGYFWSKALGWPLVWDQDQETAIRSPAGGPKVTWGGPPIAPKTGKYRLHFDIAPADRGDQQVEIDRLIALGASRIDIGQGDVSWVVMTDPDGHEFCVLPPQ